MKINHFAILKSHFAWTTSASTAIKNYRRPNVSAAADSAADGNVEAGRNSGKKAEVTTAIGASKLSTIDEVTSEQQQRRLSFSTTAIAVNANKPTLMLQQKNIVC